MDGWWLAPVAYGVGSVSWGLLVVKWLRRVDVRNFGSGKTGVTNVLRTAGAGLALLTLLGDAGKGTAVVVAARLLTDNYTVHAVVACAVIIGHVWPVLAGFRGGRGIATGAAASAALDPWAGLVAVSVFVPLVLITRYVSLGSICAVVAVVTFFGVALATGLDPLPYFMYALVGGTLILMMHRDNIRRLVQGTERHLGDKTS